MYHWRRSTVSHAHTSLPQYPWLQWFGHLSLHHLLIHLFIFNETRGHMSVYSLVYKHLGKVPFKSTLLWDSFQCARPCKVESDYDEILYLSLNLSPALSGLSYFIPSKICCVFLICNIFTFKGPLCYILEASNKKNGYLFSDVWSFQMLQIGPGQNGRQIAV